MKRSDAISSLITYHHYVNVDIIWMLCAGQSVTRITCAVWPPCSVLAFSLTLCSRLCLSPPYQRPPPSGPRTPITAAPPQLAWPCQWRWLRPSERLFKYRLIHEQVPAWLSSYSFERYVSDIYVACRVNHSLTERVVAEWFVVRATVFGF